ncbi:DUF1028 domain-containing protein [Undibacterium sp. CY18W]|uniref:DUF1028 domain-containing protein n=1 Tax=Undibacterium hunanense TaxID=2762292 RepID=A0ABR6ZSR8_9BURK|nr:DUF1028 domain-containing protein [Undibacterium hunanense]MBC3918941.1 DUF1028 domain-containing protein [Undibacterium hunanense]
MPFKVAKARLAAYVLRLSGVVLLAVPSLASATFSIVACDRNGNCGAAVATNNLAVGASVPYAQAHVGALVSQFETNPTYGPKGLALLASGQSPDAAIRILLDGDNNFDNSGITARQIGMVDARGRSATYTGAEALSSAWAGAEHGDGFSIQGNGLAGEQVLSSMKRVFLSSTGTLAERLMASLEAGEKAGGQTTGRLSAALLLKTPEGAWQDIDLRIDSAAEPVRDLRRLLEQHYALQAILRAERQVRKGAISDARTSISEALHRCHGWDRIWRRAARLAMTMGDTDRALDYLSVFLAINPVWGRMEIRDSIYQPLRTNALFKSWNN